MLRREIRPINIAALPEKKIRKALFAAGADDEIGIGNACRVEVIGDRRLRDRFRVETTFLDLAGDTANC